MFNRKHNQAKEEFWKVVRSKAALEPNNDLVPMIDYMLDKLPTWAVDKATGWMKDYKNG